MTESMVERAGNAFLKSLNGCVSLPDEKTVIIEACILRRQFDAAVRAAIAAMRKPPENLVTIARRLTETGEVVVTEDDGEEHPVSYHGFDLGALWVAVIDDMLTEETKT